jgi:hypothetical protein
MSNKKTKKRPISKKKSDARTTASVFTFVIIISGFLMAAQTVRPADIAPISNNEPTSLKAQATETVPNLISGIEALEPQVVENYRTLMLNSPRSVVEKELATQFEDGSINSKQYDQLVKMLDELSAE